MSTCTTSWILEVLARPAPLEGWTEFNLQRYLQSTFGVIASASTALESCTAVTEALRAGARISYNGVIEGTEHYTCTMDYLCAPGDFDVDWDAQVDPEIFRIVMDDAKLAIGEKEFDVGLQCLAEINAALFGYPSYAALISEGRNSAPGSFLDDSTFVVLNRSLAQARADGLLKHLPAETISKVIDECSLSISTGIAPISVCAGVEDLYLTWARANIRMTIEQDAGIDVEDRPLLSCAEMEATWLPGSDLWESTTEWRIEARGVLKELDEEDEPVPGGIRYECQGHVVFSKTGRSGLNVEQGGATCIRFDREVHLAGNEKEASATSEVAVSTHACPTPPSLPPTASRRRLALGDQEVVARDFAS